MLLHNRASWFRVVAVPVPALNTSPIAFSLSIHLATTSITSYTLTKSRVCLPSPKIIGGFPAFARSMNFVITPEYGLPGFCRGLYILKVRRQTTGIPYNEWNIIAYFSPVSLLKPYGDMGLTGCLYSIGKYCGAPYTAAE